MVALQFIEQIEENNILTVIHVTEEDEKRARAIIRQYDDKDFSLTDATSSP